MSMTVQGGGILAKNIALFTNRFLNEVNKDMESARDILDKKVKENISLDDHTLSDLKAEGHPYARRSPRSIHTPDYQVHTQSGELLRGKYSGTEKASVSGGSLTAYAYVGIEESVKHAKMVVYGTSKMVPRDFLKGSLSEVSSKILSKLSRSLNQVIVNFNGERVQL